MEFYVSCTQRLTKVALDTLCNTVHIVHMKEHKAALTGEGTAPRDPAFLVEIRKIADDSLSNVEYVMALWKEYASSGQSASIAEFKRVYADQIGSSAPVEDRKQASAAPAAPRTTVYWRDIDAAKDQIINRDTYFVSNGRLVIWHGHEASEAQNWLKDEAQIQARKAQTPAKPATAKLLPSYVGHVEYLELQLKETAAERDRLHKKLRQRDKDYLGCSEIREKYKRERDDAREQVKELLAACKKTLNDIETCTWRADDEAEIICKGLNAAIDRAEHGSAKKEGRAS